MSYCRWGGSELYVYMGVDGRLCCTGCPINEYESFYADNTKDFLLHLTKHRIAGTNFPEIEERIALDDPKNFPKEGDAPAEPSMFPRQEL